MAVTLSEAIIIQGASVVFAAGMVWAKLNHISAKLDEHIKRHQDHPERLAEIETEIKNFKNLRYEKNH